MNRKTFLFAISLTVLAVLLSACGSGPGVDSSSAVLTEAAQIFEQSLTETAAFAPPTATNTPEPPTETPTEVPPTETPTVTGTPPTETPLPPTPPPAGGGGSSASGCLRAELTWETIPDGTQLEINQNFTKRWVLKNIGTCPWTQGFAAIWVDGEIMNAQSVQSFENYITADVQPGQHINIDVAMTTPDEQGTYKGYWMLRSDNGVIFGLGPDGRSWFWLEVFVKS
ncbi:MAG: hypothetical protein KIS85_03700 [Anaerolineales bacterium]|nr:hypothetical protein [Anaerolineales bacterium]